MKVNTVTGLPKRTKGKMNPSQFLIAYNTMEGLMKVVDIMVGFPCVHDGITWRPTPLTIHWDVKEVKCNRHWFGVNEKTESMLVANVHCISDSGTKKRKKVDKKSHPFPYIASDYFGSMFLVRYNPYDSKKFTFQKVEKSFLAGMCVALISDHWRTYDDEAKDSVEGSWW